MNNMILFPHKIWKCITVSIRLFSGQRVGPTAELGRPAGLPAGAHHGGVPRRALRLWRRGRLLQRARDAAVDLQHQGARKLLLLGLKKCITQTRAISERLLEKAFVSKGRGDPQRSPLAHCHRLSGLHVHLRRVPRPQRVLARTLGLSFR